MNWKKGIIRLVWVVSICVGIIVLLFGCSVLDASGIIDAYTGTDIVASLVAAGLAFGLVWLAYLLSMFVVKGFQGNDSNDKHKIPKTPFWRWVTGRFPPENDPHRKEQEKR